MVTMATLMAVARLVQVRTSVVHWESGRREPVGVTAERLEAVLAGLEAAR